jgi:hypothetical protein
MVNAKTSQGGCQINVFGIRRARYRLPDQTRPPDVRVDSVVRLLPACAYGRQTSDPRVLC